MFLNSLVTKIFQSYTKNLPYWPVLNEDCLCTYALYICELFFYKFNYKVEMWLYFWLQIYT